MVKKTSRSAGNPGNEVGTTSDQFGLERMLFFSDAVFAIAITLLALEIRLPASEDALTNGQLLQVILSMWPRYLSYVLSFLVIGVFWIGHHKKFRLIQRYDGGLQFLNMFLLMGIAFVPFPSAVLSEYGNRTATLFYAVTMTVVGLLNAGIWIYSARGRRLIDPAFPPQQLRRETLRALVMPAIFVTSIGLAFLDANSDIAKYSWLLIAVILRFA